MFVMGNLLLAVAQLLDMLLGAYTWVVIISALISWVNPDPYNPVVRFLRSITEPLYGPIRRKIGLLGAIDVSPIIVLFGVHFLRVFLVGSLAGFARRMM
ncbi:YggT family protein [Candidatus Magnetobacterium casensis]|uniref:YggT family protein n=2 Tax=Candidatus Magnetobacterium casense TaxID=1455061 RepID=A0ABS6S2H8_9BACT|nr:YggT family protein [Candidatus Magnetobacterium casensis]